MTNTEIIQAIKAEMERRWKHHRKNFVDREEDGDKMEEDAYLLQYLSDLEKSVKPMNHEGLQEEIVRTYHNGSVADTSDIDHVTYENIAEHFYERQFVLVCLGSHDHADRAHPRRQGQGERLQ